MTLYILIFNQWIDSKLQYIVDLKYRNNNIVSLMIALQFLTDLGLYIIVSSIDIDTPSSWNTRIN
jgi:hypothetical protein